MPRRSAHRTAAFNAAGLCNFPVGLDGDEIKSTDTFGIPDASAPTTAFSSTSTAMTASTSSN
jgi:hypothetical protein